VFVYISGLPEDSAFKSIILAPYKEADKVSSEQREALTEALH